MTELFAFGRMNLQDVDLRIDFNCGGLGKITADNAFRLSCLFLSGRPVRKTLHFPVASDLSF